MVTNTPYDEIEGREKQYLETCRLKQDIKSAVVTYWLINLTDESCRRSRKNKNTSLHFHALH